MARKLIETTDYSYVGRDETQNFVRVPLLPFTDDEQLAGSTTGTVQDGKVSTPPPITYTAREQAFRIDIKGLRPSTPHHMYFERLLVASSKIKPVGGSVGDSLISGADGTLAFDFFYSADIPQGTSPSEIEQYAKSLLAGTKEVVVTNINQANLPTDYALASSSYFTGYIVVSVHGNYSTPAAIDHGGAGPGTGPGSGGPGDN